MFQVVIQWNYYKDKSIFHLDKARWKKDVVYFVDYDKYKDYIIHHMEYSDLQKLKLNIFNKYYKLVKYTPFSESDVNWEVFNWYKVSSPIIEIDDDEFAKLIPNSTFRKVYYIRDSVREKYFLKSNFINYVNLNVI